MDADALVKILAGALAVVVTAAGILLRQVAAGPRRANGSGMTQKDRELLVTAVNDLRHLADDQKRLQDQHGELQRRFEEHLNYHLERTS